MAKTKYAEVILMENMQKLFALTIGGIMAAIGIIGFFNNPLLGLFTVNLAHNLVHIVSGALGLWLANVGKSHMFNKWFGIAYTVIAVLGFIPFTASLLGSFLAVNMTDTVLHGALGLISLGIAYGVKAE